MGLGVVPDWQAGGMTVRMLDMPGGDRPRERLARQGVAALSDAELVAVLLGSGHAGASALDVAQRLLAEWGGAAGLAAGRPEELARATGVGPAKAARLAAAFGLAMRSGATLALPKLSDSADIAREAGAVIGRGRTEQMVTLVADGGSRLRRVEIVSSGSAKSCPMPVREVLATVLRHDGVAFAVAHNHPGGDPTPTHADRQATAVLQAAAQATGLRFLDHVIVTAGGWRSVGASGFPAAA
jgi:DNA repair protein RadC